MIFKLAQAAEKHWRRLDGQNICVLKKYERSGNPDLRAKVQQAIASVTRSLIPNPASR